MPGKLTLVIEPWHAELQAFLDAIKQSCRQGGSIAFTLSVPDLLIDRVATDGTWSLFRPEDVPGLASTHGQEFNDLYTSFEQRSLATSTYPAKDFWAVISLSIWDTDSPSITYKDIINCESRDSASISLYTIPEETACCNNAAISLVHFIKRDTSEFDFSALHNVATILTRDLNHIIFANNFPTQRTYEGAIRHRAIGVGVIGLADVFTALRLPYESSEALQLSSNIMQTIYHASLEESHELTATYGLHFTFTYSPASFGTFDFNHWPHEIEKRYDWSGLAERIKEDGLCNAQVTTVSDFSTFARIASVSEGVLPRENIVFVHSTCPFLNDSNIIHKTLSTHSYNVINPALVEDLERLDIWNDEILSQIIEAEGNAISRYSSYLPFEFRPISWHISGSVQDIVSIPRHIKELYKTAWEVSPEYIMKHARHRAPFVSHSESLVLYHENPPHSWIVRDPHQLLKLFTQPNIFHRNSQHKMLSLAKESDLKTALYTIRRKTPLPAHCITESKAIGLSSLKSM
ncbi:hypothetical protein CVT26_010988 [Gymnopilus dilepis]|uniref:Ribonucleotide reductase large subunit C-terminal domain-containing protein n=1 Tax=Gymnopilus dilepis TaxID=231916 RepID=A0A409VYB1_9AGAR|nr:hypothetical protein CVT26_010988 [Gymnopilus dilepis]